MIHQEKAEDVLLRPNICWSKLNNKDVKVTPVLARRILEFNTRNRPVRTLKLREYSEMMTSGSWVRSSIGTISIHIQSKTLLDGQHRLMSIIASNTPIWCRIVIVTGDFQEISETIDCGARRNASDALAIAGYKNTVTLASAGSLGLRYLRENPAASNRTNNTIIRMFVEGNPLLCDSCTGIASGDHITSIIPRSVSVFCHYLFGIGDPDLRDKFFEDLCNGSGGKDSAVERFRSLAIHQRLQAVKRRSHLPQMWMMAIFIKSWNAYIHWHTPQALRWSSEEKFPRAISTDGSEIQLNQEGEKR
jgi:hypothetical protein